jgi:hypothetical protein
MDRGGALALRASGAHRRRQIGGDSPLCHEDDIIKQLHDLR